MLLVVHCALSYVPIFFFVAVQVSSHCFPRLCIFDHNPLVVPGVQATEHQTKALGHRRRTPALGDHERSVDTEIRHVCDNTCDV